MVSVLSSALLAICAGCVGGDADQPQSSPLTDEQAGRLANVLFDNLDSKGATFQANARSADGSTINLVGEIDWVDHRGHAGVTASGVEVDLVEIFWSEAEVLERRPGLNAQLLDSENVDTDFIARPAAGSRALDRLLAIVTALAGPQRDNPLLIKQEPGSIYLRADELRGRNVDVMRYGEHNVYWIDRQTGFLLRLEDLGLQNGQPFVIDIISRGPQTIVGPAAAVVVPAAELGTLYPFPIS